MRIGEPIDRRVPWARALHDLDEARATGSPGPKLRAMRRAAEKLGDELRAGPRVVSVRTLPISDLIYPTKFAFSSAVPLPWPFVIMKHRALLVQLMAGGQLVNVLFNPTDAIASRATPYFHKIIDAVGEGIAVRMQRSSTVEARLAELGLSPADIDVITFDHFHTQDLRPMLGTADGIAARFPNAVLLAPRREWEDWDDLHPLQRAWFVADGKRGVPAERVVLYDSDVALGDGCLLVRTPGHTSGNQTLFVRAEHGVFGCSENGCSADSWSPLDSRIPGLRRVALHADIDVILNNNTPELGVEQYTSMVVERAVVDRVPGAAAFVQMFPSSEVTATPLAPGIKPTMVFGERTSGTVQPSRSRPVSKDASPQSTHAS